MSQQGSARRPPLSRALLVWALGVTVGYVLLLAWLAAAAFRPSLLTQVPDWLAWFAQPTSGTAMLVAIAWGSAALVLCVLVRRSDSLNVSLMVSGWCVATAAPLALAAYLPCSQDAPPVWSAITSTLALFFGNFDDPFNSATCSYPPPLAIQISRLIAATATLAGAAFVLSAMSRSQLDRLAVTRARALTVLVDVDDDSSGLVQAIARTGEHRHRTVVLTPDQQRPAVRKARAEGVLVLEVDLDDHESLSGLRLWSKAERVFLLAADGTRNRQRAEVLRRPLGALSQSLVARVDDPWQAEEWRRAFIGDPDLVVDAIGIYEETADALVQEVLAGRETSRVLVLGSSPLILALCAELSQRGRELEFMGGPTRLPQVVLVSPDASEAAADHALRETRFASDPLHVSTVDLPASLGVAEDLLAQEEATRGRTTVIVVEEVARLGIRLSLRYPNLEIFEVDSSVAGVQPAEFGGNLSLFGLSLVSPRSKAEDAWERAARAVHERYRRTNPSAPLSAYSWDELPREFYRSSNRRQVLTTLESARTVGRSWLPTAPDDLRFDEGAMSSDDAEDKIREGCTKFDLRPDELTTMSELEHRAWMAHYRRDGWRQGPRDDTRKLHPLLLPWAELPQDARTRTRSGVIETLFQLRALGYRSVPAADSWGRYLRIGRVRATQLSEPLVWSTDGGDELRGEAGDWLVVDESGGRRTVHADAFPKTHERESGETWRRTSEVLARHGRPHENISTPEGPVLVTDGDWVVQDLEGRTWVVPGPHFAATYRPASPPQ